MALNSAINNDNEPLRAADEHFILLREKIGFEIIIEGMG